MSAAAPTNPSVERKFNHDLLLQPGDQAAATLRWPTLSACLIEPQLLERFRSHEALASRQKQLVQNLGSTAVALMLVALLGAGAQLWVNAGVRQTSFQVNAILDSCAIAGLVLALLSSHHGPIRRRWLKNRFMTEVLRQWHFRRLLNPRIVEQAIANPNAFAVERDAAFSNFLQDLDGNVGQKMDELSEMSRDPGEKIPRAELPRDPAVHHALVDAYRTLRLEHQRLFAIYKLSPDDQTLWGFSVKVLVVITDLLAGMTLVLALVASIASIVVSFSGASVAALCLAVTGVAVRSWRDGLALGEEHERYQEMLHRLELITERWYAAKDDSEKFKLAEEIEQMAVEELRSFVRTHERAQFLF